MRVLFVACLCLTFAALGVLSAARAFPEAARSLGLSQAPFAPVSETKRLRQALGAAWEAGASLEDRRHRAVDLWRHAPLDDAPVTLLAYALATQQRAEAADKVLGVALKRNPRSLIAHMVGVQRAIDRKDFDRAVIGFETLLRLDGASEARYMRALAQVAENPQAHEAILRQAASGPAWADALVRELGRDGKSNALLIGLGKTRSDARQAQLNRLMESGRVEEAFVAWLDSLPPEAIGFTWPYDGAFRGAPGVGPFNWTVDQTSTERVEGGGIHVVYLGRGTRDFAQQVMLLSPGTYRLTSDIEGQMRARGGRLQWVLGCFPSGPQLLTLELSAIVPGQQSLADGFTVPAGGCPVQRLSLRGVPGDLPLWAKATVTRVRIETVSPE